MRPFLAAVCALTLLLPATALADPFDDVFADYQKDGRIDPCAHSPKVLQQAKADIPNDIEQYAPDFPAELDEAMEARARANCAAGGDPQDPVQGDAGAAPGGAGGTPAPPAAATIAISATPTWSHASSGCPTAPSANAA